MRWVLLSRASTYKEMAKVLVMRNPVSVDSETGFLTRKLPPDENPSETRFLNFPAEKAGFWKNQEN
jgi:hypothetical protein